MKKSGIIFKGFAALLIILFLRIPLSDINSHTYTIGVTNETENFGCFNCFYEPPVLKFTELKEFKRH